MTKIKTCIQDCKTHYDHISDKRLLWDLTKCEIRSATISYAIASARSKRELELELSQRLQYLETQLAEQPTEEIQKEYELVST